MMFPREIGLRRSLCRSKADFSRYVKRLNGKSNLYTSLYSFDGVDPKRSWKVDYSSAIIDKAWWDFDADDSNWGQMLEDVETLLGRLEGDVRLVFTGRVYHVYQMFSPPVRGGPWPANLQRYQHSLAKGLGTLDGVGFPERLCRVPWTYNITRKSWCVPVDKVTTRKQASIEDGVRGKCPFLGVSLCSEGFDIRKWVKHHPRPKMPSVAISAPISTVIDDSICLPPCLDRSVRVENPNHKVRVALAQFLAEELRFHKSPKSLTDNEKNDIVDSIVNFISSLGWRDYNETTSRKHTASCISYGQSPSCRWYINRGMCPGKCSFYDGSVLI